MNSFLILAQLSWSLNVSSLFHNLPLSKKNKTLNRRLLQIFWILSVARVIFWGKLIPFPPSSLHFVIWSSQAPFSLLKNSNYLLLHELYFLSIYLFVLSSTISSLRQIHCYPYIVDEDRTSLGFPGSAVVQNPPAKAGDLGLIPGLGRSPGSGNGNPLQYSCLGNPGHHWASCWMKGALRLPWQSSGWDSEIPLQETQVLSLVQELRSHILQLGPPPCPCKKWADWAQRV